MKGALTVIGYIMDQKKYIFARTIILFHLKLKCIHSSSPVLWFLETSKQNPSYFDFVVENLCLLFCLFFSSFVFVFSLVVLLLISLFPRYKAKCGCWTYIVVYAQKCLKSKKLVLRKMQFKIFHCFMFGRFSYMRKNKTKQANYNFKTIKLFWCKFYMLWNGLKICGKNENTLFGYRHFWPLCDDILIEYCHTYDNESSVISHSPDIN